VIEAPYGHDCFLLEEARQTPIIRRFLAGVGARRVLRMTSRRGSS
jgi:homoserine O-acetyltransferase